MRGQDEETKVKKENENNKAFSNGLSLIQSSGEFDKKTPQKPPFLITQHVLSAKPKRYRKQMAR